MEYGIDNIRYFMMLNGVSAWDEMVEYGIQSITCHDREWSKVMTTTPTSAAIDAFSGFTRAVGDSTDNTTTAAATRQG